MTAVALESEIVSSRYDATTRMCFYTIARNGQRWTAAVPLDHLDKHKGNRTLRRNHLANVLTNAMRGLPDGPAGTKADPFMPATWQDFDKVPIDMWYFNPSDGQFQQKK